MQDQPNCMLTFEIIKRNTNGGRNISVSFTMFTFLMQSKDKIFLISDKVQHSKFKIFIRDNVII